MKTQQKPNPKMRNCSRKATGTTRPQAKTVFVPRMGEITAYAKSTTELLAAALNECRADILAHFIARERDSGTRYCVIQALNIADALIPGYRK